MVRHAVTSVIRWLRGPMPAPPESLRSTRLTSLLGAALGVTFAVCLGTGLISHLVQHPPGWFWWPSRPVGLYRFTQGVHVATGLATVPLLGAKLWSVYPRLFVRPAVRSIAHAAERASVGVLVAAALFQVVSGVLNVSRWYAPMPFFFTSGHYWVAWLVAGAMLVHVGVQLPAVRAGLTTRPVAEADRDGLSRRGLLGAVGAAAGLITLTTVGQTVRPLSGVAVLAPRLPNIGPQGLPVNATAVGAGVGALVTDPGYRLAVTGTRRRLSLDLSALAALPQYTADLPIACVEGWSATGRWTGVRLRDLVALAGDDPGRVAVLVESLQTGGRYRSTTVPSEHTRDPLTLLALRLNGEPLHLDHGYPVRLIAPNRPGVLQTKWIGTITVLESR